MPRQWEQRQNVSDEKSEQTIAEWARVDARKMVLRLLYDAHGEQRLGDTLLDESVWRLLFEQSLWRMRGSERAQRRWSSAMADEYEHKRAHGTSGQPFKMRRRQGDSAGIEGSCARTPLPPLRLDGFAREYETELQFCSQHADSFLCGAHAANNVARGALLMPHDLLGTIEQLRNLEPLTASIEELSLALLRYGVFTLPLRLCRAGDLSALADDDSVAVRLLKRARGMIVYQPGGVGGCGHYVSLVHDPNVVDRHSRWLVHSGQHIAARGATPFEALSGHFDALERQRTPNGDTFAYERAVARRSHKTGDERAQYIGLLPTDVRSVVGNDGDHKNDDNDVDPVLLRYLMRRTLSELRLISLGGGERELLSVAPVAPGFLCFVERFCEHDAAFEQEAIAFADSDAAHEWSHALRATISAECDGRETINVASVLAARHHLDAELARCAASLVECIDSDNGARWRWVTVVERLRHVRSALSTVYGVGLLFAPLSDYFGYCRLVSTRRWANYFALHRAVDLLLRQFDGHGTADSDPPPSVDSYRPLVRLIVCTLMHNNSGECMIAASHSTVFDWFSALDVRSLPFGDACAPPAVRALLAAHHFDLQSKPMRRLLLHSVSYDKAVWLLCTAEQFCAPAVRCAHWFARDARAEVVDDCSRVYDWRLHFANTLRSTLFSLPFEATDFAQLAERLGQLDASSGGFDAFDESATAKRDRLEPLRKHCFRFGDECVRQLSVGERPLCTQQEALRLVDEFGFSMRGAQPRTDRTPPRFVERAAELGIAELTRAVFGTVRCVDDRAPVLSNVDLLPLPAEPGRWRTTAPRNDRSAYPVVEPFDQQ